MPYIFIKYYMLPFFLNYVETRQILIKKKVATINQNWKAKSLKQECTTSDNFNLLAVFLPIEIMVSQKTCPFNSPKGSIYSACAL